MKRFISLTALLYLFSLQGVFSQVPETLSYQGMLTGAKGEALPDKEYKLTFKFYDAATGGNLIWSEAQPLQVQDGAFEAQLGSSNPLAIPFDQPYWLAIAVESDEELTPRIQLSAAAYSLSARSIADSAVTSEKIADAQVVRSINGLKDDLELRAGRNISITQEGNKVTISAESGSNASYKGSSPTTQGDDGDWVINRNDMYSGVSGNVGIGTTAPRRRLDIRTSGSSGVDGIGLQHGITGRPWGIGIMGFLNSNPGAFTIEEADSRGVFSTKFLIDNITGNVGIGTTTPQTKLDVHGALQVTNAGNGNVLFNLNSERSWAFRQLGSGPGTALELASVGGGGNKNFVIKTTGNVGIGATNPMTTLDVNGGIRMGSNAVPSDFWGGNSKLTLPGRGYLGDQGSYGITLSWNTYRRSDNFFPLLRNGGRNEKSFIRQGSGGVEIATALNSNYSAPPVRLIVKPNGNVGIGTTNPQSQLHVVGTITTSVLTITGGADLAEPFAMSDESIISVGDVVVIDAENPGQLKRSEQAYDSRVAGIVSGAGGVNPGLTLKQEGTLDNGQNVALTGRVYAKATAHHGAIMPGDLLTTSGIAGHAMKATDRKASHGAIIGKAMTSLDAGEGLVLVLVNLQ